MDGRAGDDGGGELLARVRAGLVRRRGQWPEIAELSEVPRDTISKIARGVTEDPGVQKVERLERVLRALDASDARAEAERSQLSLLDHAGRG